MEQRVSLITLGVADVRATLQSRPSSATACLNWVVGQSEVFGDLSERLERRGTLSELAVDLRLLLGGQGEVRAQMLVEAELIALG